MSFGGAGSSFTIKKFETEGEVEEKKRKRQEEWEQLRKPDQPLECPEEPEDNRSLYEKLEEQKRKQQEQYDEQHALKNNVKGLVDDEVEFLDYVSQRQMELAQQRNREEAKIMNELKKASVHKVEELLRPEDKKQQKPQVTGSQFKKSQQVLLAGAVKRKSTEDDEEKKKRKISESDTGQSLEKSNEVSSHTTTNTSAFRSSQQTAQVVGILPSLVAYDDETSDSGSSSDSDINFSIIPDANKIIMVVNNEIRHKMS